MVSRIRHIAVISGCLVFLLFVGCKENDSDQAPAKAFNLPSGEYVYTDEKTFSYPESKTTRRSKQNMFLCHVENHEGAVEIIIIVNSKDKCAITGKLVNSQFLGTDDSDTGKTEYRATLNADGNLEGNLTGGRPGKHWKAPFRILRKDHTAIVGDWMPVVRLKQSSSKEKCEQDTPAPDGTD